MCTKQFNQSVTEPRWRYRKGSDTIDDIEWHLSRVLNYQLCGVDA
jgi:hypothetical protein